MSGVSEWKKMKSAPRNGKYVLLWIGETIPDLPDIRIGQFCDKRAAKELGEDGEGWLIWNADCDWFVVPSDQVIAWATPPLTIKP